MQSSGPKLSLKSRRPSTALRVVAVTTSGSSPRLSSPRPCLSESDELLRVATTVESTGTPPPPQQQQQQQHTPAGGPAAAARAADASTAESSVETIVLDDTEGRDDDDENDERDEDDNGEDGDAASKRSTAVCEGDPQATASSTSRAHATPTAIATLQRAAGGVDPTTRDDHAVDESGAHGDDGGGVGSVGGACASGGGITHDPRSELDLDHSTPPANNAGDSTTAGTACCPVCREPFPASQDSPARARHVNTHFASPDSAGAGVGAATDTRSAQSPCKVCRQDMTYMSLEEKALHVNECLDAAESASKEGGAATSRELCPMCRVALPRTQAPRMAHLKRCATAHGVTPAQLITLVRGHLQHVALDDEWRPPGE
jgi:hypothetical protein